VEQSASELGSPGDPGKAKATMGWTPEVSFEALVSLMVEHDRVALEQGSLPEPS
jgi:GDP-D-mannose dehydratase